MRRTAAVAAIGTFLLAGALQPAFAQAPPAKTYKPGEYELYNAVIADVGQKNFSKALTDLNAWKEKVPQSDYGNERAVLFVQTYGELKQHDKVLSEAAPLVNQDLDKLFPDPASGPQNVLTVLATVCTSIQQIATPTPEQIATAQKAADMLEKYNRAPQGMAPAAWAQAQTQLQALAKGAKLYMVVAPANAALARQDCEAAQTAFSKALSDNPQNSFLSYQLGQAYMCTVRKTPARNDEVRPKAIYEYIRTLVIDPSVAGTQDANKMKGILEGTYVNYHGGSDGLDQLKEQVKNAPLPPDNFTIENATKVAEAKQKQFESQYPQLAMWLKIKGALASADGVKYFDEQLKNSAVPKLRGTIVEGKPACRSKELIVSVPEPNQQNAQPVITLKLDAALTGKPSPGDEIHWEGVPSAFNPDPFMLTMDTEKAKIEGLKVAPCAGAAPARPRPGAKKGGAAKKK
jgi:outer membrane protein assembly factor BamD (BamD/ComL family)